MLKNLVLWLALALWACAPALPKPPGAAPPACSAADLATCERAMLTASDADLPALLRAYSDAAGAPSWLDLWRTMRSGVRKPLLLAAGTNPAPAGFDRAALPPAPRGVARERLLARLGAGAGRRLLAIVHDSTVTLVFPDDALATTELALTPMVRGSREHLAEDAALAALVDTCVSTAARFDYLHAAAAAEQLLASVQRAEGLPESRLRALRALALLSSADLLPDDAHLPSPSVERASSAYAGLMLAQLASEPAATWARYRALVAHDVGPARATLLDAMFAQDRCSAPMAPPIEGIGDVLFAPQLARALDASSAPGSAAATGKLALADWLRRYDRLTQLVEQSKSAWAHLGDLLLERGELAGLGPTGTQGHARVTKLALAHLHALDALVRAYPSRYSALSTVAWAQSADARVRSAIAELVEHSVRAKIAGADGLPAIYEAALTAFAVSRSSPPPANAALLGALRDALAAKLAGRFGARLGWESASLHAAQGVLAWLLGEPAAIDQASTRISAALAPQPDQPLPELARLVDSAARYAPLAVEHQLDATVANTNLFPAERRAARDALAAAIADLHPAGPQTPPEKELAHRLAQLGDDLVAAMATELGQDHGRRCHGDRVIGENHPLRDSFNRLRKERRRLLEATAFHDGRGPWVTRARVLSLLLSDVLDIADREGDRAHFTIEPERAAALMDAGLRGWLSPTVADVVEGGYLLLRAALGGDPAASIPIVQRGGRALAALSQLLEQPDQGVRLLATLAELLSSFDPSSHSDPVGWLVARAASAYDRHDVARGDLMLSVLLAIRRVQERPIDAAALQLAEHRKRDVLSRCCSSKSGANDAPGALAVVARRVAAHACPRVDVEPVLAVRQALFDYATGDRQAARTALRRVLDGAEHDGLVIPKRVIRLRQRKGHAQFHVEQAISLGRDMLPGSSSLSFGLTSASGDLLGGTLDSGFADPDSDEARDEAARYYAHTATVLAVLDWLD